MKNKTETTTAAYPLTWEEANNRISNYFKGVESAQFEIGYTMDGSMSAHISYNDFKPAIVVRKDLEAILPCCQLEVVRDHSFETLQRTFKEAYDDFQDWTICLNGELKNISIVSLVYNYLRDKDLCS